jgi:hypothetical protein
MLYPRKVGFNHHPGDLTQNRLWTIVLNKIQIDVEEMHTEMDEIIARIPEWADAKNVVDVMLERAEKIKSE